MRRLIDHRYRSVCLSHGCLLGGGRCFSVAASSCSQFYDIKTLRFTSAGAFNKLWNRYFSLIWLWEVRVFTGERRGGDTGPRHPRTHSPELLFVVLLFVSGALLAYVAQIRMRVGFGGERLLAAAPRRQQLTLLRIPPLHPAVLEPDFHLNRRRRESALSGSGKRTARPFAQITHESRSV